MVVAIILVSIAGFLIVAGFVIATIGFFMQPGGAVEGATPPTFGEIIGDLLRRCFGYMFGKNVPREKRIRAYGIFLILLGVGFLLAAGLAGIIAAAAGTGGGGTPTTPSESTSTP